MVDIDEVKAYLFNEFELAKKNREHYLANDDEVDADYEAAKMDTLWDALAFVHEVSTHEMEEVYNQHKNPVYDFDPQSKYNEFPIIVGQIVELTEDVLYSPLTDAILNFDKTKEELIEEGFKVVPDGKDNNLYIPKGTVMTFTECDAVHGGWPTFKLRMKYKDYEVDFAGEPFKIKIVK